MLIGVIGIRIEGVWGGGRVRVMRLVEMTALGGSRVRFGAKNGLGPME